MTTQKEIDEQIHQDYTRFYQSIYDGELPPDIMYKFRTCLMWHNAKSLPTFPVAVKNILEKKEHDFTFFDVGVIINTIMPVPYNCIYESPEQAIEATIEYVQLQEAYNKKVDQTNQQLERKRAKKYEICGLTKTAKLNGTLKPLN